VEFAPPPLNPALKLSDYSARDFDQISGVTNGLQSGGRSNKGLCRFTPKPVQKSDYMHFSNYRFRL